MIKALRQVTSVGFGAPAKRAMAYMITPERKNLEPAMRKGGID